MQFFFFFFPAVELLISSAQRQKITVYSKVSCRFSPIFLWVIGPVKLGLRSDGF